MHTPLNPLTKEHGLHSEYQVHNTEFKMPTRKEKESLLKRYAKKLGLNDRGCYLAVGLAVIAFLLLLVIIIMSAEETLGPLDHNNTSLLLPLRCLTDVGAT